MKPLLLPLLLLFSGLTLAQSKKQQLISFQFQLDSMHMRIDSMTAVNSKLVDQVNRENALRKESKLKNEELNQEILRFKYEVDSLKSRIAELEFKISPTGAVDDVVNLNYDQYSPNRRRAMSGDPFGSSSSRGDSSPTKYYSLVDFGTANYGLNRSRFSNYSPKDIRFDSRVEIHFRLYIDPNGRVVHVGFYPSSTNTTDVALINKIGQQIMEQVYCSKDTSASLEYLDFLFSSH